MVSYFYGAVLAASVLCSVIYIFLWHRHFDANLSMVFTLAPLACLGYFSMSISKSLEGALAATRLVYLGGCFLQLFVVLSILHLCQIPVSKWVRTALLTISCVLYAPVINVGYGKSFYKHTTFEIVNGAGVLTKEYGIFHTLIYVAFFSFFVVGMTAIVYSYRKKTQVPKTVLYLLTLPYVICVFTFFIIRKIIPDIEFVPLGYALAQVIYLIIAHRMNLYNVSDTVIDSMVKERAIGYVSCDFKHRFLGCNETAKEIFPELSEKRIDEVLGGKETERKWHHYLESFEENEEQNAFVYTLPGGHEEDEKIYNVSVGYLYDGNKRRGYLITFTDDTANRKYIQLLDTYNEKLQSEVEEKTHHIVEMHDHLIMSLAIMVESRDNSTGGHIKRTSEGVRILIDAILEDGSMELSEEFCKDVIKAAPMHDLGKVAVDDAILRKPGRFTDEEFEQMKKHAAEGAKVIHEILLHTDDESFKKIAENVAHYHHERWDGSGYPEGLKGEEIPLEARIMAVADVYDALVSKRVYKEAFDFEKANRIIMEGMGSQFDPGLQRIYEKARPKLEAYYKAEE